jgi:hypothetical protein
MQPWSRSLDRRSHDELSYEPSYEPSAIKNRKAIALLLVVAMRIQERMERTQGPDTICF